MKISIHSIVQMSKAVVCILLILTCVQSTIKAQVAINTDGSSADVSAILDIKSTSKGILLPRMTSEERSLITSPAQGLMVFDNSTNSFWYYDTTWQEIGTKSVLLNLFNDTRVQVEESADEDKIRFDTDGIQRMLIDKEGAITHGIEGSTRVQLYGNSGVDSPFALSEYWLTEAAPRWVIGRDVLGEDQSGIGFIAPGGSMQSSGAVIGTPAARNLSISTSNGAVLMERMRIDGQGSVGIGTSSPDPSAVLDLSSSNKGLLPPRMTFTQISSIQSPVAGLIVHCSDCKGGLGETLYYNNSNDWTTLLRVNADIPFYKQGLDIDGEVANDQSGSSVSISANGTRIAFGAPPNNGGYVKVYEWNGTAWGLLGQKINGEMAGDYSGVAVSLSEDGNRVAIGARLNGVNGLNSGHARVYQYNGSSWVQLGQDIDSEAADDQFGESISISSSGSRVAIGASYNDGNGSNSGHVRVYDWNGTIWMQIGQDIDGENEFDGIGAAVSISGDGNRVAIGAPAINGNAGQVRIHELQSNSWVQLGLDIDGEASNDNSGCSVSLSADGNKVAIGAYANYGANGAYSGHVRVYNWNGGAWVQMGEDIDGEAANDYSGESVSLSADGITLAIGASGNDGNGANSGQARIYKWNGDVWVQQHLDIDGEAANDRSGKSISISSDGKCVIIGAPENQAEGFYSGHVRVYCQPQ